MVNHVVQFTESERVWSGEDRLTPHYYGDPGHFTSCPVCEYVLWVY